MREQVEAAVKDFHRTMGVDMSLPESGRVQHAFETGGTFYIELVEKGVAFYLLREHPEHNINAILEKALELCHFNQSRKFDTQCGLKDGNQILFMVFMTTERITGPDIESILQHLMKLQEILSPS